MAGRRRTTPRDHQDAVQRGGNYQTELLTRSGRPTERRRAVSPQRHRSARSRRPALRPPTGHPRNRSFRVSKGSIGPIFPACQFALLGHVRFVLARPGPSHWQGEGKDANTSSQWGACRQCRRLLLVRRPRPASHHPNAQRRGHSAAHPTSSTHDYQPAHRMILSREIRPVRGPAICVPVDLAGAVRLRWLGTEPRPAGLSFHPSMRSRRRIRRQK